MLNDIDKTDWLSSTEQAAWFTRYKTQKDQVTGINLEAFKNLIDVTHRSHCAKLLDTNDQPCPGQYKDLIFLNDDEVSRLFKLFDLNKDGLIDMDEFKNLCEKWLHRLFKRRSAFIIVDVQNDFIDGSLALMNGPAEQDGADVVGVINRLLETWTFDAIVYTQDWHPIDHIGFYENLHLRKYQLKSGNGKTKLDFNENNEMDSQDDQNTKNSSNQAKDSEFKYERLVHNAKLFDVVLFDDGKIEQKLWPVHCVQNSWGAELHNGLKIVPGAIRILKGTLPNVDAYSAFWDNMRLNETGLKQELLMRNVDDVFVSGLALDYCVASTALDSARAGFKTYVIEDACRGIDHAEMALKRKEMRDAGITIIDSKSLNYPSIGALQATQFTRDLLAKKFNHDS